MEAKVGLLKGHLHFVHVTDVRYYKIKLIVPAEEPYEIFVLRRPQKILTYTKKEMQALILTYEIKNY